jgi:hypothetical protein
VVSWSSCVRTKGMEEVQCGSERSKAATVELLTTVAGEGDSRRTAALGQEGASGVAKERDRARGYRLIMEDGAAGAGDWCGGHPGREWRGPCHLRRWVHPDGVAGEGGT